MKKHNENGSVLPVVLLIIMILGLALLTYILLNAPKKTKEIGTDENYVTTFAKSESNADFDDGLKNPYIEKTFPLDETGAGLENTQIFNIDINNDGTSDRITKSRYENGNSHFYFEYKIELNMNGEFINITPDNFKTVEGSEVSLQKIRFVLKPKFEIIRIYRPWQDSWDVPTMATKYNYRLQNNNLIITKSVKMKITDDVSKLF